MVIPRGRKVRSSLHLCGTDTSIHLQSNSRAVLILLSLVIIWNEGDWTASMVCRMAQCSGPLIDDIMSGKKTKYIGGLSKTQVV